MKRKTYLVIALLLLFVLVFFSIIAITARNNIVRKTENKVNQKIEEIMEEVDVSKAYNENCLNADCNGEIWFLIIPSLEIKAQIKEGVDKETLKYDVRTFRRNQHMETAT